MTGDELRCFFCRAVIPLAKSYVGKTVVAPTLGAIGLKATGHPVGGGLFALAGLLIGHFIDLKIDEAVHPVCARCKALQPA